MTLLAVIHVLYLSVAEEVSQLSACACRAVYDAVVAQLTGVDLPPRERHGQAAPSDGSQHVNGTANAGAEQDSRGSPKQGQGAKPVPLDLDPARSAQLLDSLDTWTLAR